MRNEGLGASGMMSQGVDERGPLHDGLPDSGPLGEAAPQPAPQPAPPRSPRETLLEAARADRSYASFFGIARALARLPAPELGTPVRIALLGTATLSHIRPYLEVHASLAGFIPSVYVGPFDQVQQEIWRDDSGLYAFQPDVVILACEARDLLGDAYDYPTGDSDHRRAAVDAQLETLLKSVQHLLECSRARVLIHSLAPPPLPLLGILDQKEPYGCVEQVRDFNHRLIRALRPQERAFVVDYEAVLARVGRDVSQPEPRRLLARIACDRAAVPVLCEHYERFLRAFLMPARKVLVLDLDNTLWGGVIGEDGLAGIRLGHDAPGNCFLELQRTCLQLSRRGVVLALCSKNNLEDALSALRDHPAMLLREDHFAAIRCNWQEKALNLQEIAQELSLGLDSFVFLDDNPVERAKVRELLPQVLVVEMPADPALYARTLAALPDFEAAALTDEDRRRGALYVQRRQTEALRSASGSLEDFLAQLESVLTITPVDALSLPRCAQLELRTNQFNTTGRRRSEADLEALSRSLTHRLLAIRLRDRFGDQGQVGFVVLEWVGSELAIDSLLLSCRVLGRGVEQALLAYLERLARDSGARRLLGRLRETPKNKPARALYPSLGMALVESGEELVYARDLHLSPLESPGWLKVEG